MAEILLGSRPLRNQAIKSAWARSVQTMGSILDRGSFDNLGRFRKGVLLEGTTLQATTMWSAKLLNYDPEIHKITTDGSSLVIVEKRTDGATERIEDYLLSENIRTINQQYSGQYNVGSDGLILTRYLPNDIKSSNPIDTLSDLFLYVRMGLFLPTSESVLPFFAIDASLAARIKSVSLLVFENIPFVDNLGNEHTFQTGGVLLVQEQGRQRLVPRYEFNYLQINSIGDI